MTLKQQQDRNITMLKTEFERKAGEVHKIFEKAMKTVSHPITFLNYSGAQGEGRRIVLLLVLL